MKLTQKQKNEIIEEIEAFKNEQYANTTKEERKKLSQFFTPGNLVIKMIEKFDDLDDDILDPTCGAGNLLLGCIIAGADPKRCFGIEIDPNQAELCRKRLSKYGVPEENIVTGDALNSETYKLVNN